MRLSIHVTSWAPDVGWALPGAALVLGQGGRVHVTTTASRGGPGDGATVYGVVRQAPDCHVVAVLEPGRTGDGRTYVRWAPIGYVLDGVLHAQEEARAHLLHAYGVDGQAADDYLRRLPLADDTEEGRRLAERITFHSACT